MNVAQQRLDALDTWHAWANAAPVGRNELSQILTLEHTGADGVALVNMVRQWSVDHNIELPTTPSTATTTEGSTWDLNYEHGCCWATRPAAGSR